MRTSSTETLRSASVTLAGMRNILVHEYLEIDPRHVWRALGRLDDLRTFADASRRVAGV